MNITQITDIVKDGFSHPTVNTTIAASVQTLNSRTDIEYGVSVVDIVDARINDGYISVSYRIYVLDRMQTNESFPIRLWDWGVNVATHAYSVLNNRDELSDVDFGVVNFIEQDFGDVLGGVVVDLVVSFAYEIECL